MQFKNVREEYFMRRFVILLLAVMTAGIPWASSLVQKGPRWVQRNNSGNFCSLTQTIGPWRQSCAACHGPEVVSPALTRKSIRAVGLWGSSEGPLWEQEAACFVLRGDSPSFISTEREVWVGVCSGRRAPGAHLRDRWPSRPRGHSQSPRTEHPDMKTVCVKIKNSSYAALFEKSGEKDRWTAKRTSPAPTTGSQKASLLTSVQGGKPIHIKVHYWLRKKWIFGRRKTRPQTLWGQGKCAECHPTKRTSKGVPPVFTDFTYDNLGIPKNPKNPFYAMPASLNPAGRPLWIQGWRLSKRSRIQGIRYEPEIGSSRSQPSETWTSGPPPISWSFGITDISKALKRSSTFTTRRRAPRCEKMSEPGRV